MENVWTKVLVETTNDGGETWRKDFRYFYGDLTKKDLSNDTQFTNVTNKKKVVLDSLVYTEKDISSFKPELHIIREIKI